MWIYEKMLQYPVNIKTKDARLAKAIISQFGGPDGELTASTRYLTQRYAMPNRMAAGLLNDVGTEELAHFEMIGAIIRQLTRGLSAEELKAAGMDDYYVDHTSGLWLQAASGAPFTSYNHSQQWCAPQDRRLRFPALPPASLRPSAVHHRY